MTENAPTPMTEADVTIAWRYAEAYDSFKFAISLRGARQERHRFRVVGVNGHLQRPGPGHAGPVGEHQLQAGVVAVEGNGSTRTAGSARGAQGAAMGVSGVRPHSAHDPS